jgi:hypothetical protein
MTHITYTAYIHNECGAAIDPLGQHRTAKVIWDLSKGIRPHFMQAILLEINGKKSSSKRTRALNIQYFFLTDQAEKGNVQIEYCPTDDMVGNFHTKPLEGEKFRRFRDAILGHESDNRKPNSYLKKEKKLLKRVVFNTPFPA